MRVSSTTRFLTLMLGAAALGCSSGTPAPEMAPAPEPAAPQVNEAGLPTAAVVVARFVEALGGRDAIMAVNSIHGTGKLEVPAQGITGDIELFASAPNRMVLRAVIPGLGTSAGGFDGTVGWANQPGMGPMVLDGLMLDQMRQQADFYSPFHSEQFVATMETVEEVEFAGTMCYKVKIVTRWDEEYHEFFAKDTGLLMGNVRSQATPMGNIEVTTVASDYRAVGGMMVAFRSVQQMMGMEQIFAMDVIEAVPVADSVFALPQEIQALVGGGQ